MTGQYLGEISDNECQFFCSWHKVFFSSIMSFISCFKQLWSNFFLRDCFPQQIFSILWVLPSHKKKLCNVVLYLNVMFQAYMIHNQEKHLTMINLLNTPLHIINGSLNDLKIIYKSILIFEFSCFFVSEGFHNPTSVIK